MKRLAVIAVGALTLLTPSFSMVETGLIAGSVHYPACFAPADLEVCAVPEEGGPAVCTADFTSARDGLYYVLEVPAGKWLVYSTAPLTMPGVRAFYTDAVRCGLSVECRDHSRIAVEVRMGALVEGIQPDDWFDNAPAETGPPEEASGRPVS